MKKIIGIIQVVYGYILLNSILNVILFFLPQKLIFILFCISIILLKITPHPTSHQNPFAFSLDFRFSHN